MKNFKIITTMILAMCAGFTTNAFTIQLNPLGSKSDKKAFASHLIDHAKTSNPVVTPLFEGLHNLLDTPNVNMAHMMSLMAHIMHIDAATKLVEQACSKLSEENKIDSSACNSFTSLLKTRDLNKLMEWLNN